MLASAGAAIAVPTDITARVPSTVSPLSVARRLSFPVMVTLLTMGCRPGNSGQHQGAISCSPGSFAQLSAQDRMSRHSLSGFLVRLDGSGWPQLIPGRRVVTILTR
jgi:hypothetical protein